MRRLIDGTFSSGGSVSIFVEDDEIYFYETEGSINAVLTTTSDVDGNFKLYIDDFDDGTNYSSDQTYKMVMSKSGYTTKTFNNIQGTPIIKEYVITDSITVIGNYKHVDGVIYVKGSETASIKFSGGFSNQSNSQCFDGFDPGDITFDGRCVDTVHAEWWGAYSTESSEDAIDCNDAILCAIATGLNVKLFDGYYGISGSLRLKFDGQKFRGTGRRMGDDNGGTTLYKLSGTSYCVQLGAFGGLDVGDFTIDGNDYEGDLLQLSGAYYSGVSNIFLKNTGSYALHSINANVNSFNQISIGANCYGGIHVERTGAGGSAGYSDFNQVIIGPTTAYALLVSEFNVSLNFNQFYAESPICIEGSAESIKFDGLSFESAWTSSELITVNSINTRNVKFQNLRVNQSVATAYPVLSMTGLKDLSINGFYITDLVSPSRDVIALDGVYGATFENSQVYSLNTFDFIECSGDLSYFVDLKNCNYTSGAASTCKWKTAGLKVVGSNMNQEFVSGCDSRIIFENIYGSISLTNVGSSAVLMNTSEPSGGLMTDLTFAILGNKRVVIPYYYHATEPSIAQDGIARWSDTSTGKFYLIVNFGGVQKKIELV